MDATWRARIFGSGNPDGSLRHAFAPPAGGPVKFGDLLKTYDGPGKDTGAKVAGWVREQAGTALADAGTGNPMRRAAEGVDTIAAGGTQAFASGAAGASSAPAGGIYAQMLNRNLGFQIPTAQAEQLPGAVAAVADEAPDVAAPVVEAVTAVDTPVAAVADEAASKVANLEQQFIEGFQRLGTLSADQRIPTLAKAIDAGAAAGHGDDAFGVLAATLAARPLEHSVPALSTAIDDAVKVAPAVAEVVTKAAPVVERAAPILDDVVKAAPVIEQAVAKSAPILDDVAHAAAAVVKPSVVEAVLPVADDALRNGLKGAMGFSAGIDDTLRLLAKF